MNLERTGKNTLTRRSVAGCVARRGRQIKCSDRMARDLVRYVHKNLHITAKELQKRVACTVALFTVRQYNVLQTTKTYMEEMPERSLFLQPQHKMKRPKYTKENIEKPEAFWNNVTDKTKLATPKKVLQDVRKASTVGEAISGCLDANRRCPAWGLGLQSFTQGWDIKLWTHT